MKWKYGNILRAPEGGEGGSGGGGSLLGGSGGSEGTGEGEVGSGGAGSVAGEGGPWYAGIDESLVTPFVKEAPDLATFVKSANHTKSMVGADKIALPSENAGEDAWNEFYSKLGRPDDATGYKVSDTTKLPDGVEIDSTQLGEAQSLFHKLGLNSSQGQGILDWYYGSVGAAATQTAEAAANNQATARAALQDEWGENYNLNLERAQGALKQFEEGTELLSLLEESGLGDDPRVIKYLAKIGAQFADDSVDGGGTNRFLTTQSQAKAEIDNLKSDSGFMSALRDSANPGHKVAVERWEHLHGQAG